MFRIVSILSIAVFLFLTQCTMDPASNVPEQNTEPGQMLFKLNMSEAPADVVGLSGKLSRDGQDTLFFDFELKDGYATAQVEDLASGIWKLKVDAFNADGAIIYNGSTIVTVEPGVTTPVYLNLNPTTGSLEIVVTWGEAPFLFDSLIIAYYPFDNSLKDLSKYQNNGIGYGGINYGPGIHNQAAIFDSYDDFIEIGHIEQYNIQEKTVAFWFYKTNNFIRDTPELSDVEGLVLKAWDSGLNRDFTFTIGNQQSPFYIYSTVWDGTDSLTVLKVDNIIYPQEWYFAALVMEKEETKLYLNGDLICIANYDSTLKQNDAPIILGKATYYSPKTRYFNGKIDELIILNKALSYEEISQLYNKFSANLP